MKIIPVVLSIALWVPLIAIKWLLIWPVTFVVVSIMWLQRVPHEAWPKFFRNDNHRPFTYHEMVFRNFAEGVKRIFRHPPEAEVKEAGRTEPGPTYHPKHFAWRWRRYGMASSIRLVWVYPFRKYYGELYLGFKLNSEPPDLDFATSLRPFAKVGR